MKNIFCFFVVLSMLYSCSNPEDSETAELDLLYAAQKWQLARMSGSFENSETTGESMAWQEFYVFNPAGSFVKERDRDGVVSKATGIFILVKYDNDDMDYLELTYTSGEDLIGSCNGDRTEILVFRSVNDLSNT